MTEFAEDARMPLPPHGQCRILPNEILLCWRQLLEYRVHQGDLAMVPRIDHKAERTIAVLLEQYLTPDIRLACR